MIFCASIMLRTSCARPPNDELRSHFEAAICPFPRESEETIAQNVERKSDLAFEIVFRELVATPVLPGSATFFRFAANSRFKARFGTMKPWF